MVTNFGKFADPLADKILVLALMIILLEQNTLLPGWAVTIILAREFIVTGFRIIAADKKYPYGSIMRIKSSRAEFLAIVMDRGGDIGFGRRFDVDLLCESEASANSYGTTYNVTFEILRYGY